MSSLRPVGRSAATLVKDRVSACRFTFADGRPLLHSYTFALLHSQTSPALTPLNATLTNHLTSVDSKQLTISLNPSESTLTKNMGGGGVMVNQATQRTVPVPSDHRESRDLS